MPGPTTRFVRSGRYSCSRLCFSHADSAQPSATGSSWEKYKKNFADDEIEEKKITPLTEESVSPSTARPGIRN